MRSKGTEITQHTADATATLGILSQGWVNTVLGDISEINPKLPDECLGEDIDVTFLPMRCVEELTGTLDLSLTRKLLEVKKGYTPFRDGDVLFAKITPCMENGKVAVVHGLRNGIGFGSTEFHVIRLPESLPARFIFYWLVREDLRKDARANMTGSAGQLRVPVNYLTRLPIKLPPLAEQHRIVAKIEELFTRLDAGVEALTRIKAQLKRYRQAVLKHAFEGKLTVEWRRVHQHELEPASVLLERTRQEHQKSVKGKHKELPPLDASGLPDLPEGWVWARIGDLCETTSGGTPSRRETTYYGGDIPWLKSGELKDNVIRSVEEFITEAGLKHSSAKIIPKGSLLMALYGATVGKLGMLETDSAVNQAICAIFVPIQLDKTLLFWYLIKFRYELLAARRGGAQPNISLGIVNNIVLPLSPSREQKEVVSEIERRLSVADQIEKTVDQGLKQAERLRQSILKKAFEGKLVRQDPSDEPAEMLLERTREERARAQVGAKSKKVGGKKTTRQEMRLM